MWTFVATTVQVSTRRPLMRDAARRSAQPKLVQRDENEHRA
jgi:hypothetical protein